MSWFSPKSDQARKVDEIEQEAAARLQAYEETGHETYHQEAIAYYEMAERERARLMLEDEEDL